MIRKLVSLLAKNRMSNQPTRICMLVTNDVTMDGRVQREANSLANINNVSVDICGIGNKDFEKLRENTSIYRSPISKISIPLIKKIWGRITFITFFYRRMKKEKYDVIIAHDFDTLFLGTLLKKRGKLIYDCHELGIERQEYNWLFKRIVYLNEKFLIHKANGVMTTTQYRADYLKKMYGLEQVFVQQNRSGYKAKSQNKYLHAYFGIPTDSPIAIYQGGIQYGRGMRNIIKVAIKMPHISFVFLGDGEQLAEIKTMVSDNKLNNVYFHDQVKYEDLHSITFAADIGLQLLRNVSLNHYSTDSNKIFEYLMAELPMVVSDFPEIRKAIDKYDVATFVDPEDIEQICRAIQNYVDCSSTNRDKLHKNIQTAKNEMSWDSTEKEFTKFILHQ